jgi:hypothetical protein
VVGGDMKITAYYLIRGQSIQPLIDCNTDAECYEWSQMSYPPSDEDKRLLFEYWTSETFFEGEPFSWTRDAINNCSLLSFADSTAAFRLSSQRLRGRSLSLSPLSSEDF